MTRTLLPALLAVCTASLIAQSCPDRTLGNALGSGDEVVFPIQAIGFAFPFAGMSYTDVHVCTNGYLTLSNAGVPAPGGSDYTATQADLAGGPPRICALWCDLNVVGANGSQVYINSSPSKCTITWDRVVNYGMTTQFQVQLQLFPTGEIVVFYSAGATNNSTYNYAAGIGMVGVSPGGGVTLPAPSDLSAAGNTTDASLFEEWLLQTTFDMPLQSLHLIPTPPGWTWLPAPWTGCATATDYGTGCINAPDSFYEVMSAPAFDLAGSTLSLLRTPTGYTVLSGLPGAIVPPSASALIVANGDDVVQTVGLASPMPAPFGTTSSLTISSNGTIALSAGSNGASFAPDVGNFLAYVNTALAPSWHDYNPAIAGSGKILFEQTAGFAYVTWDNVYVYNTTVPDRFQCQFELATGNMTVVYDAFGGAGPDYLVGYSVGGPSVRPEASDVSALLTPIHVVDTAVNGLRLTSSGLPILGNPSYALQASFVPNLVPLGFLFFGTAQVPGLDLTFLGMPGCRGYTNANLTSASFPVALPAGTGSQPLPIPSTMSLAGTVLTSQAVAFSLATPLNLVTSNGTRIDIGL
ncbi:MAG TPA: hypothetical protein VFZ65_17635 [Planctomycetota bacterium]|nr:hypothetical protein [Planctomycetota bacterium]